MALQHKQCNNGTMVGAGVLLNLCGFKAKLASAVVVEREPGSPVP